MPHTANPFLAPPVAQMKLLAVAVWWAVVWTTAALMALLQSSATVPC